MSKQLTFPCPTAVVKIDSSGRIQHLIYGTYEAVMIVKENGLDVHRTKQLIPPKYPVEEVECEDGSKLLFPEPFYYVESQK